jgi:hypothetical protein
LRDRASEAARFEVGGEERALDEGQVAALGVLLALRHDEIGVGQVAHDGAHADAELGRGRHPAMAVRGLVPAGRLRVGPHQDRHLLPRLGDAPH